MTREESIKLLALIKVAYPTAYKDMDKDSKLATVNMWQMSFPRTPFVIMEMAFERFRRKSKFPPTVAEMIEELRDLHYTAIGDANMAQGIGDHETFKRCMFVMDHTSGLRISDVAIDYRCIGEDMLAGHEERAMLAEGGTAW